MEIAKTIGQRIFNRRTALKLTLDFLADHLDLTTETIDSWEKGITVPFADQLVNLSNILHSDVLWIISGHGKCGVFTESGSHLTSNHLNSWSTDIGNCRMAVCNAMDCIPQELSAIGTLTLVFEKLRELEEVISKKADKIEI